MYGIDHFGMGVGGFAMLLVWLLPLVLVWLLVRAYLGRRPPTRTALEILEERYARGEIERDEYLKRRADLQS